MEEPRMKVHSAIEMFGDVTAIEVCSRLCSLEVLRSSATVHEDKAHLAQ